MTQSDAFQTIRHELAELAKCESGMTVPVDALIAALSTLRDCDVTVGAMRHVMHDINDNLIKDFRRQSKQAS